MIEINYYEYYKKSKDIFSIRVELVTFAMNHVIKPATRKFSTTVKTVKKWIYEFNKRGKTGLCNKSSKPRSSPNEMLPYWKFKILEECKRLKDNNKRIRAKRIKEKLEVPYSLPTILKFIKKNGYLKIKNTKRKE